MRAKILVVFACLCLVAGCGKKPETLVTGGYDEKAMDAAILRAKSETDAFLKVLAARNADSFSVKAPISEGAETEHFWLTDITYKDGQFTGKIANEPGIVNNVKFGQEWKIKKEKISDWMYVRGDKIYGGYTIDPLLATMPRQQADEMRRQLVR